MIRPGYKQTEAGLLSQELSGGADHLYAHLDDYR